MSQPINTPRSPLILTNSSQIDKNNIMDPHVVNLEKRLEENWSFLDSLRRDSGFQNILTLMHKAGVPEEHLLKFLTGDSSLEECFGKSTWMINFLVGSYNDLEIKSGWFGRIEHFLSKSLANTLLIIFKPGYLESPEKTHSKMNALMHAIEEKNNSGKLDLAGTDFSFLNMCDYDCHGFDSIVAEFYSISVRKESKSVMLAESGIDLAFLKIEEGKHEEAIKICETIYTHAKKNCRWLEQEIIGDKLFEAALEIFFGGYPETAGSILYLPNVGTFTCIGADARSYNTAARSVVTVLENRRFSAIISVHSRQMVRNLEKAIAERVNLKFTAYFLGKVFEEGRYGVTKNDVKAKEYLEIASERGYEPRSVKKLREAREAYILMREAQESNESIFSLVPRDIIDYITCLRLKATLAQPKFDKTI
jgi:hypothetical protein